MPFPEVLTLSSDPSTYHIEERCYRQYDVSTLQTIIYTDIMENLVLSYHWFMVTQQ